MNVFDLSLTASNVNVAVDAIIARLLAVTDENGTLVYPSVTRGLGIPSQDILEEHCPAIRILEDSAEHEVEASSHFFDGKVVQSLSFYHVFYALPSSDGTHPNVQQKRNELIKFLLESLHAPDDNTVGLTPPSTWWFEDPQVVQVDHLSTLRVGSRDVEIEPPYYVSKIELKIGVHNYP